MQVNIKGMNMEEIVSLVVANGLWAVLFCGLLVYELRDSRSREKRYTQTIRALSERLNVVTSVKADTTAIKIDTDELKEETTEIKCAVVKSGGKKTGGGTCVSATT